MEKQKIDFEESVSEREPDAEITSSASIYPSKLNEKKRCSSLKSASCYLMILGVIILASALLWTEQIKERQQMEKSLQQMEARMKELQREKQEQHTYVKVLEDKISLNQKQYQDHLSEEKKEREQMSKQRQQMKTRGESQIKDIEGHQVKRQEKPLDKPKEGLQTSTIYTVNEDKPQIGGLKEGFLGTTSAIHLLSTNQKGQKIDEVLYQTQELRDSRKNFHNERKSFVEKYKHVLDLNLVIFNNKIDSSDDEMEKRQLDAHYDRINKAQGLESFPKELPICILTPSYLNNAKFRIQYNLNSIFTQNYTNYYAVILNDASPDGSDAVYRKYFQFYKIPSDKYIYVNNSERKGAMENDYIANHKYCSEDAISLHLDGDDELIGKNVFKTFNAQYQKRKAGALYSNFIFYSQNSFAAQGFTSQFPQSVKKENSYKKQTMRYSHLKSYRTGLFRKLEKENFLDHDGKFFGFASDVAFYLPIMEVSCQRVFKIEGFHYLYNTRTGNNEDQISRASQVKFEHEARAKPKLSCDEEYFKKIDQNE